ncbi:hypothetical protein Htur_2317 [Haloterrigena turkmenica DSM 5511]|uniref:Uncharacterized protein n=1 Tax=Haloterrigena turkmenica (strain ATCC 51198 / DSM 5511 / JCM 9101 / NCIMB 13204 / VKM B-1734 / 4k) TaxID=543526 RepID=D2RUM5_HALTV|nr:hypothetical protein [Haloterrigena turkmenica]ADB61197.1 hypothetical protein Htur_2317 [Haloterrigena turkmenica DSM 5511]
MEENHMNKHFHDSRYYLARSAEHAKLGLGETLTPYATRLRAAVGRDEEPEEEPTRLEAVREELLDLERKAEAQAREAAGSARATLSRPGADEPVDA